MIILLFWSLIFILLKVIFYNKVSIIHKSFFVFLKNEKLAFIAIFLFTPFIVISIFFPERYVVEFYGDKQDLIDFDLEKDFIEKSNELKSLDMVSLESKDFISFFEVMMNHYREIGMSENLYNNFIISFFGSKEKYLIMKIAREFIDYLNSDMLNDDKFSKVKEYISRRSVFYREQNISDKIIFQATTLFVNLLIEQDPLIIEKMSNS